MLIIVGKTPESLLSDPEWDKKTHAWLDPTGENNMNKERRVKLSNIMFFDQRIRNIDRTFANCLSFVYAAVSYMELKQMSDKINISVQRGAKRKRTDGTVEYRLDDGFQVFDNVKNTPRYDLIELILKVLTLNLLIFLQVLE